MSDIPPIETDPAPLDKHWLDALYWWLLIAVAVGTVLYLLFPLGSFS